MVFFVGMSAGADPLVINKDWTLEDLGSVCVASTQRVINTETYRLELALDKSGLFPVETLLRITPDSSGRTANFVYDASKKVVYHFAPQVDAAGNVSYWQIPRSTEALVSYIKRGNSFSVNVISPASPAVKVDFSLRGSSATVDALQAKCSAGRAMTSSDFEKNFLDMTKLAALDPALFRPDQIARMRAAYFTGYAADAAKKLKEKELSALTTKYAKLIQELAKVEGTLDQLNQKELATLTGKKMALEEKIKSLEMSLSAKQSEIASKDIELQGVNAAYDSAWQQLAPHEPEFKRLSGSVSSAQSSLNSAQNRLESIDGDIAAFNRDINNLETEATNKRWRLNSSESELDRARRDYNQASRELNSYDERREIQERLRRSPGYENDRREIGRLDQEQNRMRGDLQGLEREFGRIKSELETCRSAPEPQDCQAIGAQVDAARDQVQRVRQELQRTEAELRVKQSNVERAERQAQNEVHNEKSRLAERERRARGTVAQFESEVSELERRIRDINQFEIPSLQNKVSALRGERPGVESNIRNLKSEVASRRAELDKFKQRVGYDAKRSAVEAAASEVGRVSRALARLEGEKSQINGEIAVQKKALAATMKSIENVLNSIQENQGKSTELKNLLQPYFVGKAALEAEIATQMQRLEAAKVAFNSEF